MTKMIQGERRHNGGGGMGFSRIESFLSDIFSCAGGCDFAVSDKHSDAGRSYSSVRPIDSVLQENYRRNHQNYSNNNNQNNNNKIGGINFCGVRNGVIEDHTLKKRWNCASKEIMIACDEQDENSVLNETGTTHPDSFLLDESSSSLPHSIAFQERRIPMQTLQEPPELRPERKAIMVPTETVVGVWPPVVPVRKKAEPRHRHDRQQSSLPLPKTEEELFPIRPPKIRRLTLDDALTMGQHDEQEERFRYDLPCEYLVAPSSCGLLSMGHAPTAQNPAGLPRVPKSVYRSRSLDFLFSSKNHRLGSKRNAAPRMAGVGRCPEHHYRVSYSSHNRGGEDDRTRQQLLEMLSDLNETYATL